MKDRDTGEHKGYSFVAFKTKEVAQKAIEEIHSKEFKVFTMLPKSFFLLFLTLIFFLLLNNNRVVNDMGLLLRRTKTTKRSYPLLCLG